MIEPRVQYATTPDGVSIAYSDMGEGDPIVYMSGMPWTHIQLQWQLPQYQAWLANVFLRGRLIQYDARNSGLSDRNVADISLEAFVSDLETVVDRLNLERFTIAAAQASVMPAVVYAIRHPERVSHNYFWNPIVDGPAFMELPQVKAFFSMMEYDWNMFVSTVARATGGWDNPESKQFEAFVKEAATQQDAKRFYFEYMVETDVTPLLSQVTQPTLVTQHKGNPLPPSETGRMIASRIPNCELLMLDGTWQDYLTHIPIVETAMDRLLGPRTGKKQTVAPLLPKAATPAPRGGLVTILFTDVEGSTALTQRLGDVRARVVFREHERITREALREFGGSEVKSMGDGFMASFVSATQALQCAISMQRAFAAHNEAQPDAPLNIRIGLNTGEPIAEEEDLFGTAVITAARIAGAAKGGEVLASNVVRELVAGRGFAFADRGEMALRGFDDPVRVFELRWRE
jgi:class 3 adenylate cyclase/pimeloyl-ACP methyl ester carboxylesterase